MRKSKATSSSSSSVPPDSGGKNKRCGNSSTTTSRSTTATIKSSTTTTTSGSSSACGINGTRSGSSNEDNNNVQSAGKQQQRPPLDRQFDVVTAPLATFDTVDLSDDEEVATTKDTSTTASTTITSANTNSPSSTDNNKICRKKTTTIATTAATTTTAAGTHEIETTYPINKTTSCSDGGNVSASGSTATNSTNSTAITTTTQNLSPVLISDRKSGVSSCTTTISTKNTNHKIISGSSSSSVKTSRAPSQEHTIKTTSSANTNGTEKNTVSELANEQSTRPHPLPDGVKDRGVNTKQTRVTDSHVGHSSSSDDEEKAPAHATPVLLSASPKKRKSDAVSVESIRPAIGGGSVVTTTAAAAGTITDVGATAASTLSTCVTDDFANFGSCEELNGDNIGGSQSTVCEGGGLAGPAATTGGSGGVSKPKEVSAVEKANLLDESSSSDSDLSPTEPGPSGGSYTTLKSGSTPNLIRKISHEATSTIKENSTQPVDFNSPEVITSSSKRKAYERRLQRLQVKTTPINRPRSTTPLSVVTLDEYTNLSSPEISPNLEKLKIVLPADQFGRPIKSPRSKENTFDFNEDRLFRHTKEAIVLQSDGSIGQSPRRILIPPTLSPSQSPCKAAAGSPVSKLVLVSRLPAATSPLVKSAAPPPPPPVPSLPPPPSLPTTTATASFSSSSSSSSSSCSTSSLTSATAAWKSSDKQWEQFEEAHSKVPQSQAQTQPRSQPTCSGSKRSEQPASLPDRKPVVPKIAPPGESGKGQKEQEKRKKKLSTGEEPAKSTFEQHADLKRSTTSALNPSHHHKAQMNCPEEEEQEEILKVEIGSSEIGKAYNIELEVPVKEKLDSSYSKSSS